MRASGVRRLAIAVVVLAQVTAAPGLAAAAVAPAARAAFQQGLAAARGGDWRAAVAQFLAAEDADVGAPEIAYNLGVAESNLPGGDLRAIAWFEAYLLADPQTPGRAAVQSQIDQLGARLEARYGAMLDAATDMLAAAKVDRFVSMDATMADVAASELFLGRTNAGLAILRRFDTGKARYAVDGPTAWRLRDALSRVGLTIEADRYMSRLEGVPPTVSPFRLRKLLEGGQDDMAVTILTPGLGYRGEELWQSAICWARVHSNHPLTDRLVVIAEKSTNPSLEADLVGWYTAWGRRAEASRLEQRIEAQEIQLYKEPRVYSMQAQSYLRGLDSVCNLATFTDEARRKQLTFVGTNGVADRWADGTEVDETRLGDIIQKLKAAAGAPTSNSPNDASVGYLTGFIIELSSVMATYREVRDR
jgi:hypothetical protein